MSGWDMFNTTLNFPLSTQIRNVPPPQQQDKAAQEESSVEFLNL